MVNIYSFLFCIINSTEAYKRQTSVINWGVGVMVGSGVERRNERWESRNLDLINLFI